MKIHLFKQAQGEKHRHHAYLLWLASAIFVASWPLVIHAASDVKTANDTSSAEEHLRIEIRELLLRMIEAGTLSSEAMREPISIAEPARHVTNLGLLIDSASGARAKDGLRVVGTTPGSNGARIGVRSGDILLSVNGSSLIGLGDSIGGGARAAQLLREVVEALNQDDSLTFEVLRGNQRLSLVGNVRSVAIPALQLKLDFATPTAATENLPSETDSSSGGCGRISMLDIAPRSSQLHGATVVRIDGKTPGVTGQNVFRVPAGKHLIEVGELIESRYLSFNDRQRNVARNYKSITLDVAADTTYFVAARLIEDKRNDWKNGAYWETAIWKTATESCR